MPITPNEMLIIATLAIVIAAPTINHIVQLFIEGDE